MTTSPQQPPPQNDDRTTPPATKPGDSTPGGNDPFSSLYRMSTTAGVGTYDYIAVNTPAVVSIFAGLASFLALASYVLLVVPAFAIVCAIVAFAQIGKSNGTQKGYLPATGGILLALAVCGWLFIEHQAKSRAFEQSKTAIALIFKDFAAATASGDNAKAYSYMGGAFQSKVKLQDFDGYLKLLETAPSVGRITALEWNQLLEKIDTPDNEQSTDIARAVVSMKVQKDPARSISCEISLVRRKDPNGQMGNWKMEQVSPVFDSLMKPPAGQQQPGQQPPG